MKHVHSVCNYMFYMYIHMFTLAQAHTTYTHKHSPSYKLQQCSRLQWTSTELSMVYIGWLVWATLTTAGSWETAALRRMCVSIHVIIGGCYENVNMISSRRRRRRGGEDWPCYRITMCIIYKIYNPTSSYVGVAAVTRSTYPTHQHCR